MGLSPAFPGMFFAFAGMALLIFASVTPPAWDKVNFLDATAGGTRQVYGVFGKCIVGGACSTRSLGYDLGISGSSFSLNDNTLYRLTESLILHPIAAGLGFFAVVFGLLGILAASRLLTIIMAIFSFLGAVTTLVIFVIDMVIWNVLKNRIRGAGFTAQLGNANWFTVGAVVAYFLATCTSLCGACGRFATGRAAGEKY